MAATPTKGKTKSDFKFGKVLGEGAFSIVQHAVLLESLESSVPEEYAIKIMDKHFIKKMDKVKFVMMEKKILSRINHELVVRMMYTFQDSTSLYIVLELVRGGELLHAIRYYAEERSRENGRKAFTLEEARYYAGMIVVALEYLHMEQKVVHRDLKPENILLTSEGKIKLTDFGSALDLTDSDSHNAFCGTAEYVSPEVLRDEEVGRGVDLWALGCIIYQMLVGKPPFKAESEYLIFQLILNFPKNDAIDFPSEFPEVAKDLILKLIVQDPSKRLGAGEPGSGFGYEDLKAHPFFTGFDWKSPTSIPVPLIMPVAKHTLSLEDFNNDSDFDDEGVAEEIEISPMAPRPEAVFYDPSAQWKKFLLGEETVVLTGLVWKKNGFFSKKRQLILTSTPRLIYVDPEKMEFRGEIKWVPDITVEVKSITQFEITSGPRTYYITDMLGNAARWKESIGTALKRSSTLKK